MCDILRFFLGKILPRSARWDPFLSVFYLTYACDFRCFYCSDGKETPYYSLDNHRSDLDTALKITSGIRRFTNRLIITGGEPLLYPDAAEFLKRISAFNFSDVVLTTNGYYIDDAMLRCISGSITECVFSLDTLDPDKADDIYKKGFGTFRRIMENIERAACLKNRSFNITISSVATPGNITDLYDVFSYAKKNGFTYAVAPRLRGVMADAELSADPEYRTFFDFLISEKKRGVKIFGTPLYLSYMRDLKKFHCIPFSMLVISPRGDIFYPCLEIGNYAGKIQDTTDLHCVRRNAAKKFGLPPLCGTQCHSACALSFALLFEYPLSFFPEVWYSLKCRVRRFFSCTNDTRL
jgi:MoaA/NifB/PqqE/SkfB family radical SAM enzyme